MSAFDQLDPLVQHHIVNTLGWRELRPLQESSIQPIQEGQHCLLLAPTAGGKTEAAVFPVLSRICAENWTGTSVLYICPLRALLNNLHARLLDYCAMVGRSCGLWHGDVGQAERQRLKATPPDILLTTPESLEVMLVSAQPEGRELLASVRVVVIDEIHAFAGDDRGWHLLAVLERIGRLAGREIQRIGLSATVGNPEDLLRWMSGHCKGVGRVINPPAEASAARTEVQLDFVGKLENAALVISRLHRGEKRLVFCDSRARVEELGNELRRLGVTTFLSHSSLSAGERRMAEEAFAQAQDCVIVATSTLELGIDVGDLDRVIQIDSPFSVASFLQRIGRTGRRPGAVRNCLFLTTSDQTLLRAGALLELWGRGHVESVIPPAAPLHLLAQQLMALALQEKGVGVSDWQRWLERLPAFSRIPPVEVEQIVNHLLAQEILFSDGVRLSMGDEGVALYGRRHFLELVSVFTSPPMFAVQHGRQELGSVHQIAFLRHRPDEPTVLSLGGRSWAVVSLDWRKHVAYVVPSDEKGRSRWLGSALGLSFRLCREIRSLLTSGLAKGSWTTRARDRIDELRAEYSFLDSGKDTIQVLRGSNQARWFTFAGNTLNMALADALRAHGIDGAKADDFAIRIDGTSDAERILAAIGALTPELVSAAFVVPEEYLDQIKFAECLPEQLAKSMLKARTLCAHDLQSVVGSPDKMLVAD